MTQQPLIGILCMLAAMMLLPVGDALSKLVVADYPAEQVAWVRNMTHAAIILPFVLRGGTRIPFGILHVLRGLSYLAMAVVYVAALRWLPLADAQALVFTHPLIVMAFSAFFLGQPVGRLGWLAGAAGLVGMLLVVQPGFRAFTPGIPLALAGALVTAAYFILTGKLSGSTTPLMMLAAPAVVSVIVLSPVMIFTWVQPTWVALGLMLLIGMMAALSHFLVIMAYSRIEPSAIAPLFYVQVAVGVFLGWLMFSDLPSPVGLAGIVIIVFAGAVVSLRQRSAQPRNLGPS